MKPVPDFRIETPILQHHRFTHCPAPSIKTWPHIKVVVVVAVVVVVVMVVVVVLAVVLFQTCNMCIEAWCFEHVSCFSLRA